MTEAAHQIPALHIISPMLVALAFTILKLSIVAELHKDIGG